MAASLQSDGKRQLPTMEGFLLTASKMSGHRKVPRPAFAGLRMTSCLKAGRLYRVRLLLSHVPDHGQFPHLALAGFDQQDDPENERAQADQHV